MPIPTPPPARTTATTVALAELANRTAKPAQRSLPIAVRRMLGLETAAGMLGGQTALAIVLGIEARSLRAKLAAERGISDDDLATTADALDARAARLTDHARKLRDVIAAPAGQARR